MIKHWMSRGMFLAGVSGGIAATTAISLYPSMTLEWMPPVASQSTRTESYTFDGSVYTCGLFRNRFMSVEVLRQGSSVEQMHATPMPTLFASYLRTAKLSQKDSIFLIRSGWPMPALAQIRVLHSANNSESRHGVIEFSGGRYVCPIIPIISGVAIDVIAFSAIFIALLNGVFYFCRDVPRKRKGRCISCGYDLIGCIGMICPECGLSAPETPSGPPDGLTRPSGNDDEACPCQKPHPALKTGVTQPADTNDADLPPSAPR